MFVLNDNVKKNKWLIIMFDDDKCYLYIFYVGFLLLEILLLNKGSVFIVCE